MGIIKNKFVLSIATILTLATYANADVSSDIAELKKQIELLQNKVQNQEEQTQSLIDETSDLQTGFNFTTIDTSKKHSGLGAAASKVYYSKSPLSIGGYGNIDYYRKSREGTNNVDNIDVYRFIPYIGYRFSDNIILNVELEFEHGGIKDGAGGDGYVIIEFMYLDFLINKEFNVRVGNMLVPMGLINEKHEPTVFTTVQRPNTSKKLVPSTWHENGILAYGQLTEDLSYHLGAFSALQLNRGIGQGNDWLRDSRAGSFRIDESNERLGLGVVARVDYTGINGLFVGASTYIDSNLVMADIHFDYNLYAFRTYGVYTQTDRSKTVIGEPEKANGGFINLGYDISSLSKSQNKMPIFIQYESVSAQDKITGGGSVDSTDTITLGINYFPHEQVVLKADYAMQKDNSLASNADETNIFSLSMGFIF